MEANTSVSQQTVWHIFSKDSVEYLTYQEIPKGVFVGVLVIVSIVMILTAGGMCVGQALRTVPDRGPLARQIVAVLLLATCLCWVGWTGWAGARMVHDEYGGTIGSRVHSAAGLWVFVLSSLLFAYTSFSRSWRLLWAE